jgi:hypothetical protein
MPSPNEIEKNLAQQIHAAHTALYYSYQEKDQAKQVASTVRALGYGAEAKPHWGNNDPFDNANSIYDIVVNPRDIDKLTTWFRSHSSEVIHAALDSFDALGKYIPKQIEIPVVAAVSLIAATSEASASTGDTLTRTEKFLNTATEDIGGKATREIANGNYDAAQRNIIDLLVPGADLVLRSKEAQAAIDRLPINKASLMQMQSDPRLPLIDRHLAEFQLRVNDAREKGELFNGLSASSTLTDLAEKKVILEAQWQADARIFKSATENPSTDWVQFKKDHIDLATQADLHVAAQNSGHAQAFTAHMDKLIAANTARGTPMQPIAQQLSQLASAPHNPHELQIEQIASRS